MKRLIWSGLLGLFSSMACATDPLLGLPSLSIPANNPQTAIKIALGKRLFHDPGLSADGSISCASCHVPERAFTDGRPLARGIRQQIGSRNSPTVANAAFYTHLFHDGRANSLETQTFGPLTNPLEHGLPNLQSAVARVCQDAEYRQAFQQVFSISQHDISIEHIGLAIASYERTLIFGNTPFDHYFFQSDQTAISESAQRGSRVFRRKGNIVMKSALAMHSSQTIVFTTSGWGFNAWHRFWRVTFKLWTRVPIFAPY